MERTQRNYWIGFGILALLALVALSAFGGMFGRGFADGYGYGFRPGLVGPWFWGFWGIGLFIKLLFWGAIAFFAVNLFRRRSRWTRERDLDARDELTAQEILRRRYAAGEITREQYDEMRRVLETSAPA